MRLVALALLSSLLAAGPQDAPTADTGWPQWLGPFRDGRSPATSVFSAAGTVRLRVAWRRPLGTGTSGLSVSGERLVTLDSVEKGAFGVALSTRDGSVLWRVPLDAEIPDDEHGPGSTPALADGLGYVLSPACQMRALDLAGGKLAWHVDMKAQFDSKPRFGCTSSPLLDGGRVIVQTGAPEDGFKSSSRARAPRRLRASWEGVSTSGTTRKSWR